VSNTESRKGCTSKMTTSKRGALLNQENESFGNPGGIFSKLGMKGANTTKSGYGRRYDLGNRLINGGEKAKKKKNRRMRVGHPGTCSRNKQLIREEIHSEKTTSNRGDGDSNGQPVESAGSKREGLPKQNFFWAPEDPFLKIENLGRKINRKMSASSRSQATLPGSREGHVRVPG